MKCYLTSIVQWWSQEVVTPLATAEQQNHAIDRRRIPISLLFWTWISSIWTDNRLLPEMLNFPTCEMKIETPLATYCPERCPHHFRRQGRHERHDKIARHNGVLGMVVHSEVTAPSVACFIYEPTRTGISLNSLVNVNWNRTNKSINCSWSTHASSALHSVVLPPVKMINHDRHWRPLVLMSRQCSSTWHQQVIKRTDASSPLKVLPQSIPVNLLNRPVAQTDWTCDAWASPSVE